MNPTEFWANVDRTGDCWLWQRRIDGMGYGRVRSGGVVWSAHRYAWTITFGEIPDGLQVDHTCHNTDLDCAGGPTCVHRRCVNPAHLELVTTRENSQRGRSANRLKTHCPRGHAYSLENTRVTIKTNGRPARACRICVTLTLRARRARTRVGSAE